MSIANALIALAKLTSHTSGPGSSKFLPLVLDMARHYSTSTWVCDNKGILISLRDDSHLLVRTASLSGVLFEAANNPDELGQIMVSWFTEDPEVESKFLVEATKAIVQAFAPPGATVVAGCLSDDEARILSEAGFLTPGESGEYTGPGDPKATAAKLLSLREGAARRELDRIFDRTPGFENVSKALDDLVELLFNNESRPH